MAELTNFQKKLNKIKLKKLNQVANSIVNKAQAYFDLGQSEISGDDTEVVVYKTRANKYKTQVIAEGSKVAFIEFGTGIYNEPYDTEYITTNATQTIHGTYGKGRGKRKAWGFYANGSANVNSRDYLVSTNKGEVIITYGIQPTRALYKAIKETQREVNKK